jgi:uncharacterized Rmd1/YagE family protein
MRWSPVSMQIRTTILNNINISANSSFSLYGVDSKGRPIGTFAYSQNKKLMRLNNVTTSLDFSLSELLKGNKDKSKTNIPSQNALTQGIAGNNGIPGPTELNQEKAVGETKDEYGYPAFDVPWSLNLSYSLNYYKTAFTSSISQTLSFSGNVSITKKMEINYTSGYDFKGKQITMTQIGMKRDLHCWEMSFNWVPNGSMQMWNFTIRVKASVLGDLKYERRKDFHDDY